MAQPECGVGAGGSSQSCPDVVLHKNVRVEGAGGGESGRGEGIWALEERGLGLGVGGRVWGVCGRGCPGSCECGLGQNWGPPWG